MKRQLLVSVVVIAFLLPASLQAAIVYEVIDLGTLGGDSSWAYSINDTGQIVGGSFDSQGDVYATVFDSTKAGDNIKLAFPGSSANCINNAGQIVGTSPLPLYAASAILFNPTGADYSIITLGTLGGDESWAYSINNAGQIVGSAVNSVGWSHATVFDPTGAGNNIDLDTFGNNHSVASAINDVGQTVGWVEIGLPMYNNRANLFDSTGEGNNIHLGALGGNWSVARSINNAGQIVGWAEYMPRSDEAHATLFDPTGAGNNINLGTLGGIESWAYSINDVGQIVGTVYNRGNDYRATLFDPTVAGNNIDLNTLIDPASGWMLREAFDINSSGWIVGWGINPQGQKHAFLLVPEPATFVLLGLGILLLRRKE